jgi:P27 family predicted phage terminase small subunit
MPKGEIPKPSAIKIAEGNRRKVAKAQLKEDPRGKGRPELPPNLSALETQLWLNVVDSLPDGLLSRADEGALESFAREWATYREADEKIKKSGLLVQSPQGPIRNPLLVVRNYAVRNMISLGGVLGLSPVARARLAAPGAGAEDPMELLLGMDGDPAGAWSTLPRTKN